MNVITKSVQLPDGRTITIETGKVAPSDSLVLTQSGVLSKSNNPIMFFLSFLVILSIILCSS